jgi:hypothetical protein
LAGYASNIYTPQIATLYTDNYPTPITKIADNAFDGILPEGIENIDMRQMTSLKEIGEHAFSNLPTTIKNPVASATVKSTTGFMMPRTPSITRLDSYCFSDNPDLVDIDGGDKTSLTAATRRIMIYYAQNIVYVGRDIFENTGILNNCNTLSTGSVGYRYYMYAYTDKSVTPDLT